MGQSKLSEYDMQLIEKYKEDWGKYMKNLPQMNNILKSYNPEKIQKFQEQAQSYKKMINSSYTRAIEYINKHLSSFENFATPNQLNEYIQTTFKNAKRIQAESKEIPLKIKESLIAMINCGWYPDINNFEFSTLMQFKKESIELSIDDDSVFVEYYKSKLADIKDQLYAKYPKRKEIFQAAFKAHEDGNYLLSIPVFLTQIDGIAIDEFKHHFFMKTDKKPKTALAIKAIQGLGEFSLALLIPLQIDQSLMLSEHTRGKHFTGLNRHQVLHGEVIDYGTESNSYKTISLLLYISQASEILSTHNGQN